MADRPEASRLYRNASREAGVTFVIFLLALTWTVGFCYLNGYQHPPESWVVRAGLAESRTPEDFQQLAGIPDWVFLGIFLPWLVCSALTVGICLGMKDDDMGVDEEEGPAHGH